MPIDYSIITAIYPGNLFIHTHPSSRNTRRPPQIPIILFNYVIKLARSFRKQRALLPTMSTFDDFTLLSSTSNGAIQRSGQFISESFTMYRRTTSVSSFLLVNSLLIRCGIVLAVFLFFIDILKFS